MFIYKTTNLINGKIYIGKRIKDVYGYLGSGKIIKRAIEKYGKENFIREIIEDNIDDKGKLSEREIYWIKYYDSTNPKIGYNITMGGGGFNVHHSEETKHKLSIANKGKVRTEEFKKKVPKELH